ncbi:IS630 transposase-related protein [Holospora elegans]|nr:IS630 transposase-related protein [Holospora elegans]
MIPEIMEYIMKTIILWDQTSNDLRQRVIEYLGEGNGYIEASQIFKISVSAIGRWYRKYRQEVSYFLKRRGGSEKKIDLGKLKEYVKEN